MLSHREAVANIAVKDLSRARAFYQGVLGLQPVSQQGEELVTFQSGTSKLNVYRSAYAGTNQATAVTWSVGGELDRMVRELRGKGVTFEHYDMPGLRLEGDVHVADGMKVAWFKDPDGNILNLVSV